MEKEVTKKLQSASAADETYKKKVEDVNSFLENYYAEAMPKILTVLMFIRITLKDS